MDDGGRSSEHGLVADERGRSRGGVVEPGGGDGAECNSRVGGGGGDELRDEAAVNGRHCAMRHTFHSLYIEKFKVLFWALHLNMHMHACKCIG